MKDCTKEGNGSENGTSDDNTRAGDARSEKKKRVRLIFSALLRYQAVTLQVNIVRCTAIVLSYCPRLGTMLGHT